MPETNDSSAVPAGNALQLHDARPFFDKVLAHGVRLGEELSYHRHPRRHAHDDEQRLHAPLAQKTQRHTQLEAGPDHPKNRSWMRLPVP